MSGEGLRILVLDDDRMICTLLRGFLEESGFLVRTATGSEEALELLDVERFDAAIVDIRLPGMPGDAFVLQARRVQPAMVFIIHTGSINYQVTPELAEIGIGQEDVIYKPVLDMDDIVRAILRRIKP